MTDTLLYSYLIACIVIMVGGITILRAIFKRTTIQVVNLQTIKKSKRT